MEQEQILPPDTNETITILELIQRIGLKERWDKGDMIAVEQCNALDAWEAIVCPNQGLNNERIYLKKTNVEDKVSIFDGFVCPKIFLVTKNQWDKMTKNNILNQRKTDEGNIPVSQ